MSNNIDSRCSTLSWGYNEIPHKLFRLSILEAYFSHALLFMLFSIFLINGYISLLLFLAFIPFLLVFLLERLFARIKTLGLGLTQLNTITIVRVGIRSLIILLMNILDLKARSRLGRWSPIITSLVMVRLSLRMNFSICPCAKTC